MRARRFATSPRADACRSSSAAPASTTVRSSAACFPARRETTTCARDSSASRIDAASKRCTAGSPGSIRSRRPRIQPRDRKRLVRALEVYLLTGRPLTSHFAATASPIAGFRVLPIGVTLPRPVLRERVARRVDAQFARGVVAEVRGADRQRRAGVGARAQRTRLSAGRRDAARRPRRGGDPRADRPREHALRPAAAHLVSQGSRRALAGRRRRDPDSRKRRR